jgi:hypothetical protein
LPAALIFNFSSQFLLLDVPQKDWFSDDWFSDIHKKAEVPRWGTSARDLTDII